MPASSRYGAARPGQTCPRSKGAWSGRRKGSLNIIREASGLQIYILDLDDDTVVTVHARFDEQIPERSQEYFEEIDNLATGVLEKAEKIDD